ncbi:hypothetical protein MRX96_000238 [Rhipicephalus microplus]
MATRNQVTGYDPESLQIIQMDTAQTETPLLTEEEYLQGYGSASGAEGRTQQWRRKTPGLLQPNNKQRLALSKHRARTRRASPRRLAKQLQWWPKNTPRIEEDDIIVVLKPRETLDLKGHLGRCTSCGVQVPAATPDGPTEHQCIPSCLLCGGGHKTGAPGCAGRFRQPVKSGSPRQQIGELRRQNQILARKIQELEAKQVGSSEPVQEAEAEDGDDGSSVTSRLTSVSRQDVDTVVGPASITGSIGRIESLEHKTEQLEASVAALPTQIISAVRGSLQDMFTAALTQALPEIVAQVSNSVLKAVGYRPN